MAEAGGVPQRLWDQVATINQYKDAIAILPDKHRILMKTLGPLYTAHMKMKMAMSSVKGAITGTSKATTKATKKAWKPFALVLGTVVASFKGMLLAMMPLMGLIFGVMGAMLLFAVVFDQGGGTLLKWVENLPIVGAAFALLKDGIAKVKETFGGLGLSMETISDYLDVWKERFLGTWETIRANVTLPEMDGGAFFEGLIEGLTTVFTVFMEIHTMVYDAIFFIVDTLIEAGFVQMLIDNVMLVWDTLQTVFDLFAWALGDTGIGDFVQFLIDIVIGFVDFLNTSGILSFVFELIGVVWEVVATLVVIAAFIISLVIKIVGFIYPYIAPYYKAVIAAIGMVVTIVMGVVRTLMAIFRAFMALLRGDFDAVGEHISSIGDIFKDVFNGVKGFFKSFVNSIIDFISPVFKLINAGIKTFNKIPLVPNLPTIDIEGMKLAKGGIASGPKSGYPATLHGTEAVVPLPDGRTIPVTIKGGLSGGGDTTVNINVSGANGDPRKIARMVGEEVGRVFKNRSRGSGISRGM